MAVQLSYDNDMQIAMPGMRSDSSLQNTDGCNAAQGAIKPGYVVARVSVANDKRVVKQVAAAGDAANLMGICRFSQYGCSTGQYENGDAVNVMTFGRIWAVTTLTSAPAMGTMVSVITSGDDAGKVAATGGTAALGWVLTGRFTDYIDNTGATVHLAEVQLRNQTAEPASA
ncbi:hypothetical protein [Pantoea sp. BAV 3049]|uniref:structural cement protein Gp24 n=1 Tax=Pantoea sp. BAV 3049 TaxID=2654188 RepID=UPI00131D0867|nr:hypothetical protein [Pantoea sp. BAV 3049]